MKDLSIPGKIRFGWPLDNEITSQEGAVKFSVRFWNKEILKDENGQDKDTVVYSFNTQTSTLNITKSLQVEINEGPSVNSPISEGFFKKAIRNSSIVNENIAIPVEPRFDEPGLNLFDFESLTENDLTMKAQATCGDTGIISYEWYYKPAEAKKEGEDVIFRTDTWYPFEDFDVEVKNEEGEITTEKHPGFNAYGGTKADEYVLVGVSGDFSLVTGEKYYMENPDTTDIENTYIPFNGSVGKNLYERFTTYRVPVGEKANEKVTGQYKVVVKNTLGPNISNEVESKVCQLVSPDDITLKINGDLPLIKIITADDNQLKLNLVDDNNFGVNRTYTWSRSIDNKETFNILEDETQNNLAVLTPGWYKVHVDSTLNRETKKLESTICKATFAPIAPERLDDDEATQQILTMSYGENAQSQTFDPDTKIPQYFATENPDDYRIFDIQMNLNTPDGYDDKLYSEEFIYIWQYQRLDGDFITLTNDDVSTDDITKPVVSGLGTNALTVRVVEDNILYTYRCIVTNVLNGEKASCSEAQALAFAIK